MHVLAAAGSSGSAAGVVVLIVFGFVAYWVPTVVAWVRRVPNAGSVTVVNLFFGWTVFGWAIALAMACRSHYPQAQERSP